MKAITHFTIDRSTWRFGGDVLARNEKFGTTYLLNEQGFMCCLGQCHRQMGYNDKSILKKGSPQAVKGTPRPNPFLFGLENSPLTTMCIGINDDPELSNEEREAKLIAAFKGCNLTLEFINNYPE